MSVDGMLVVDKPQGMSSHGVVSRLRRILGERSIGHLGTLDPMATGVLPLMCGRLTRLAQFYGDADKRYEGEIRFGFATNTCDAEGDATEQTWPRVIDDVSFAEAQAAAQTLVGLIDQMPPDFSAKKINGVAAYKLARQNKVVELKTVKIDVQEFTLTSWAEGRARFTAHVSSGGYIRSLARDLGEKLGCGAHLSALRRTYACGFHIEQAHTLEEIEALADEAPKLFLPTDVLLPNQASVSIDAEQAHRLSNGRELELGEQPTEFVKVLYQERLVAVYQRESPTIFKPKVVLFGGGEL